MLAAERTFGGLSLIAGTFGAIEQWQQWRLAALSLLPAPWLLFSLTFARGNAAAFIRKWRFILWAALVLPAVVAIAFRQNLFGLLRPDDGHGWSLGLRWAGLSLYVFIVAACVLILTNLERTFRASVGTMRWRIKFMLLGVGVIFVVRIYTSSQALLFRGIDPTFESVNSIATLVAMLVLLRYFWRTSRAETDVYPSQSVLEGSLTILLAGIYLLVVGVFAEIVSYFGGDAAFALKAFVLLASLVVLAALLQSDRVRLALRRFVSRNFQRSVYDYRMVWRKFTEATASCSNHAELCRAIVRLTAEVFESLSVSVWLISENKDAFTLAGSTSISEVKGMPPSHGLPDAATIIEYFERHADPVDIETLPEAWAVMLRQWHPRQFPAHGGNRLCVPMLRQHELIGVIIIGDRVSGISFPLHDFDMLKCIAEHASASLLSLQLSQRLLQAKELEAFQTMAAFFVHDLKNAASTLNLMLKNLPVHFADPAFREDALRAIGKTVNHINGLIGRLSMLRHELRIQAASTDLNAVVTSALDGLEKASRSTIVKNMGTVPNIPLDQEQFRKVITNLVLNATEATTDQGEVRISTSQNNGWVVLTVSDNGCGMSPEFIQRSLFRPFQTTKKNGLGIGMFQTKMIIEAHGGRISVASAPGKGTTFEVSLPVTRS